MNTLESLKTFNVCYTLKTGREYSTRNVDSLDDAREFAKMELAIRKSGIALIQIFGNCVDEAPVGPIERAVYVETFYQC